MEINCIVNENEIVPLEATPRFGSPIVHLHSELHQSQWGDFLHSVASGKQYDLKWKDGYGIVILIAVPPFPYGKKRRKEGKKKQRGVFRTYGANLFSYSA
jgi:phosphoribosylamine--glycine ligase